MFDPFSFSGLNLSFPHNLEGTLRRNIQRLICVLLLIAAGLRASLAQTTKTQLEISDAFFSLAAALNSCGYDSGLDASLPLRQAVRTEVQAAVNKSPDALQKRNAICQFWSEHQQPGRENDITPYLSLALDLVPAPAFAPTLAEADLAPDAARVLRIVPLLQKFYQSAGLHAIWQKFEGQRSEERRVGEEC